MIRLLLLLLLLNFIRSLQLNMSSFTSRLPIDKGLLPAKGYERVINSYIMHPKDQMSALFVYV